MSFNAILALEDGSVFYGKGFGKEKFDVGELVFNTSMTGYQEIITDPSYKKQIITFTHPHIGNTGINIEDSESTSIHASGIVVKNYCSKPSNWRSKFNLEEFLVKNEIIGISDIDTREITSLLREKGAMGCCIASLSLISENDAVSAAKNFNGLEGMDLAKVVSTDSDYDWNKGVWPQNNSSEKSYSVVAYDYGIKENILRLLTEYVGKVKVVNAKTTFEEIIELNPQGIFLSNGPGDPAATGIYAIKIIKNLIRKGLPIFGICLGHQLLALAGGANTYKMKFGHHGANHPVQDILTKEVFITSQNHGFAVDEKTLPKNINATHLSLFDQSLQGIEFKDVPAFSFQGHPEASPGPQEIQTLFKKFSLMVKEYAET